MQTATFKFMPGVLENDPALAILRSGIEEGILVPPSDCSLYGNKFRIVQTTFAGPRRLLELVIEYEETLRFPTFDMRDRNTPSEPLLVTTAGSRVLGGVFAWNPRMLEEIQERARSENSIALALALLDVTLDPLEAREV